MILALFLTALLLLILVSARVSGGVF
ncbi:uncharacterized protein METZ01_LOCUS53438 [marine metagenome]|uniref:Uncharacterized protein n=1 Tax=marine metagenome TaxID=408172 RepID=A0A381SAP6_9ZZZZ